MRWACCTGLGFNFPAAISNADALMAKVELLFGAAPTPDVMTALQVGGWINVPAILISAAVTWLLIIGTTESARVNAVLVLIKIAALTLFIALTIPVLHAKNFTPFAPTGATGVFGAAASIFFAYVGFDAVSTAAEETRNPQRNVPIGLIGSAGHLHHLLSAGGQRRDRRHRRPAGDGRRRGAGARLGRD